MHTMATSQLFKRIRSVLDNKADDLLKLRQVSSAPSSFLLEVSSECFRIVSSEPSHHSIADSMRL